MKTGFNVAHSEVVNAWVCEVFDAATGKVLKSSNYLDSERAAILFGLDAFASKKMAWCIKERYNPQLGTRYSALGQISKKDIREWERPLYGSNIILQFATSEEYLDKCVELGIKVK